MVFLVSGGLSEGARPFPLKILDTKISVNSTSGECNNYKLPFTNFPITNYQLLNDQKTSQSHLNSHTSLTP